MDELLTLIELAAYLRVKKSRIYEYTSQRTIPFVKVGRSLRFPKQEIDRWLRDPEGTLQRFFNANNNGGDADGGDTGKRREVSDRRRVDGPKRGPAASKKAVLRIFEGGKGSGAGDEE